MHAAEISCERDRRGNERDEKRPKIGADGKQSMDHARTAALNRGKLSVMS